MEKQEALNEFYKGLRIVLSNASAYTQDHPYFLKSVETFKEKLDSLFEHLNPVTIVVSPDSLFLDGVEWQKQGLYVELAHLFHMRKIKSLEFRRGITTQELTAFLGTVSLPVREILRRGGFHSILRSAENPHISIEELDYSQLLREEGEEAKDVWSYLFKEAVSKKDSKKINEFADNFDKIITKFSFKDFSEDEELREDLYNFLSYLKVTNKEKFFACAKETFKSLLKYKEALSDQRLDKIKALFSELDNDDFAAMFWDGITMDQHFDVLNFNLFSQIAGQDRGSAIAARLLEKAPNKEALKNNQKAAKRVQELLSDTGGGAMSEVYRNIISSLFKDISLEKGISFDRASLEVNYRFILLNMLAEEIHKKRIQMIIEKLTLEWNSIASNNDLEVIELLSRTIEQRKKEDISIIPICAELDNRIARFVEAGICEGEDSREITGLAEKLDKSSQGIDFYINKIFVEGKVYPAALRLFMKLFARDMDVFYANLERRRQEEHFLASLVENLEGIDMPEALEVLKKIYGMSKAGIKLDALRAMQSMAKVDEVFLLPILRRENLELRTEAMRALIKSPASRKRAIEELSAVRNFLGLNSKAVLENIGVIQELSLRDASFYLNRLASSKFFWDLSTKRKAQLVLQEWHAR